MLTSELNERCRWFHLCVNTAVGYAPHPILGPVPCCRRCANIAAIELDPHGPSASDIRRGLYYDDPRNQED